MEAVTAVMGAVTVVMGAVTVVMEAVTVAMEMVTVVAMVVTMAAGAQGQLYDNINGGGLEPDRYCLACLCEAASDCNPHAGCGGQGGDVFCGPFGMSRHYWQDANITAVDRFRQFEFSHCATDVDCAAATVTSYMTKFSRDCDGDGQVTCRDYGLMHLLGYTACQSPPERQRAASSPFHIAFTQCLSKVDVLLSAGVMQASIPGCHSGLAADRPRDALI